MPGAADTLVAAAGGVLRGAYLQELLDFSGKTLGEVDIVIDPASGTAPGTYARALLLNATQAGFSPAFLGVVAKFLRPASTVIVHLGTQSKESVEASLTLGGFVDCRAAGDTAGPHLITCSTPQWEVGTKAAISLKRKQAPPAAPAPAVAPVASSAAAWKLSADDDGGDELLDDDELLTEEDKLPTKPAGADDCEVGASGRKACKDCTCGRAEAEAAGVKVQLTADMLENPQSACGSCYLGDAFRCASCPYRGLPAFERGTKIQVPADFLTADA